MVLMSKNAAIDLGRPSTLPPRCGIVTAGLADRPSAHRPQYADTRVLRRARVENGTLIEQAKLDQNAGGPESFAVDEVVECTYKPALYQA